MASGSGTASKRRGVNSGRPTAARRRRGNLRQQERQIRNFATFGF